MSEGKSDAGCGVTSERAFLYIDRIFNSSVERTCALNEPIGVLVGSLIRTGEVSLRACILVRKLPTADDSNEYPDEALGEFEPIGARIRIGKRLADYPEYFRGGQTTVLSVVSGNGITRLSAWISDAAALDAVDALCDKEYRGYGRNPTPFARIALKGELFRFDAPDMSVRCYPCGERIDVTDEKEFVIYMNNEGEPQLLRRGCMRAEIEANHDMLDLRSDHVLTHTERDSLRDQMDASAQEPYILDFKKTSLQQASAERFMSAEDMRRIMHFATTNQWTEALSLLSSGDPRLNTHAPVEKHGTTGLLHLACHYKKYDAVVSLLELGADPNIVDSTGSTPLGIAAAGPRPDIVNVLLTKADMEAALLFHLPLLFSPHIQKRPDVIARLTRGGINVNRMHNGISALRSVYDNKAPNEAYASVVDHLLLKGANTMAVEKYWPMLFTAAGHHYDTLAKYLERGSDPNSLAVVETFEGKNMMSPLLSALCDSVPRTSRAALDLLLEYGADAGLEINGRPLIADFIRIVPTKQDRFEEFFWVLKHNPRLDYKEMGQSLSDIAFQRKLDFAPHLKACEERGVDYMISEFGSERPAKRRKEARKKENEHDDAPSKANPAEQ